MEIGFDIRIRRMKLRMSQKELASKLGVSSSYVCKIEKGHTIPNNDFLDKIEEVLRTSHYDTEDIYDEHPESLSLDILERRIKDMMTELTNMKYIVKLLRKREGNIE